MVEVWPNSGEFTPNSSCKLHFFLAFSGAINHHLPSIFFFLAVTIVELKAQASFPSPFQLAQPPSSLSLFSSIATDRNLPFSANVSVLCIHHHHHSHFGSLKLISTLPSVGLIVSQHHHHHPTPCCILPPLYNRSIAVAVTKS